MLRIILPLHRNCLWTLLLFCLLPIMGKPSADRTADQILGHWLFPAKGSTIEVYRSGNRYFGRIAHVSPAGRQNYGLAKNQLLIRNLTFNGKGGWSGGELIHPKTGMRFDVDIQLRDSHTLKATVYKGLRLIHKEYTLKRQTAL